MRIDRTVRLLKDKIKTLHSLKKLTFKLKEAGERIVFTNGCFDILHLGHAQYLEEAKKKGDILIVAVNSDSSIRKIKGVDRPLVNEKDRIGLVASFESVDYCLLFKEETPLKLIKELKPDILVKGADWKKNNIIGAKEVLLSGGKVVTVKLLPGRSTTGLIEKIAKIYQG